VGIVYARGGGAARDAPPLAPSIGSPAGAHSTDVRLALVEPSLAAAFLGRCRRRISLPADFIWVVLLNSNKK
jgi:hypothetical protein